MLWSCVLCPRIFSLDSAELFESGLRCRDDGPSDERRVELRTIPPSSGAPFRQTLFPVSPPLMYASCHTPAPRWRWRNFPAAAKWGDPNSSRAGPLHQDPVKIRGHNTQLA